MIKTSDLNPHNHKTNPVIDRNLQILCQRMNEVEDAYSMPLNELVTSGLRTEEEQAELIKSGKSTATISKHLSGCAVDIYDEDAILHDWCKEYEYILVRIGLWMEERQGPWQHFQIMPPMSQKRWFNP